MSSGNKVYDVIVVGAGVEGSATAYHLARYGKQTLLLEQFPLPHSRGSSHGLSRSTRKAYGAQDFYTKMMFEAYKLTADLEKECGEELFANCGVLSVSGKGRNFVKETIRCLERFNVPHEKFNVARQRVMYPQLSFEDEHEFVLDHSGGVLRADKMLGAFQDQFKKSGGIIKDGEPMIDLYAGSIVSIKTNKTIYKAKSVVLALGPWAAKFLPRIGVNIPLQPMKITVLYWKEKNGSTYDVSKFPCIFVEGATGQNDIYGVPSYEYPGLVKICLHHGPDIDADNRDGVDNEWVIKTMKYMVSKHFPTLEQEPSVVETCIYTNTPDHNFVIDTHPSWKNVVIAAGFSGHGFKLSPVVGKIASQLATGQKPEYELTPFRIDRFFKNKL
ncbi:hypothetical protein ACF0H5_017235 [Mactra antiquata]